MILTDYFYPDPDLTWVYARQCGVRHGTIRLPETKDFDCTDRTCWESLCTRFRNYGIQPLVVEPLPNCLHDHIKSGDTLRDESIEKFIRMIPLMREQGISTVCFNFMAHVGWTRTDNAYPIRGGALSTAFRLEDYKCTEYAITQHQLWENYRYFTRAVLPVAEKFDLRLALHPDDPPLPALGNVERIMISPENIYKAISETPSEMLGITFCQACYKVMGADIEQCVKNFGPKIFFVHFRNVSGNKLNFHETFHDDGSIDMARMISLYADLAPTLPVRVDHVPAMGTSASQSSNGLPAGYSATGRLFALGYLKGLLEMNDFQNSQTNS